MVFSPEYKGRLGTAAAIQCESDVRSIGDLTREAEELWKAESNGKEGLSDGWGCVTVIVGPNFLEHPDGDERKLLLEDWASRVARPQERAYGRLGFSPEDREAAGGSVIERGCLRIPWPTLTNGEALPLDLLLATATNPEIGFKRASYPTAEEIADAWNERGHVYYFRCNRLAGIHTADDEQIEQLLGAHPISGKQGG